MDRIGQWEAMEEPCMGADKQTQEQLIASLAVVSESQQESFQHADERRGWTGLRAVTDGSESFPAQIRVLKNATFIAARQWKIDASDGGREKIGTQKICEASNRSRQMQNTQFPNINSSL